MKMSKLLILSILSLSFFLSFSFANRINILDIQGRNFDINEESINSKLDELQKKYALNIDVTILGEDKEGCYLDYYFPTCTREKYHYAGDILFTIKKKLDASDHGDMETYIKDDFYFLINTYSLKEAQDKSIAFFKVENLDSGIKTYLEELDNQLMLSCNDIYNDYEKSYKTLADKGISKEKIGKTCNAFVLSDIYYETYNLNSEISNLKKKETTKKIIIYMILGIIAMFGLYFLYIHFQTARYTNKLKSMLKDIKFYKMELTNKDTFFPDAKKEINDAILSIEDKIERYLGDMDKNRKLLKQQYKLFAVEKEELSKNREKAIYDYTHQDELKEKIEEFKKKDL